MHSPGGVLMAIGFKVYTLEMWRRRSGLPEAIGV